MKRYNNLFDKEEINLVEKISKSLTRIKKNYLKNYSRI